VYHRPLKYSLGSPLETVAISIRKMPDYFPNEIHFIQLQLQAFNPSSLFAGFNLLCKPIGKNHTLFLISSSETE
jgi:hypothetical protein